MVIKKQQRSQFWIIVGIVLLIIYAKQSGFLGALITVCTNNEPGSFEAFQEYMQNDPSWNNLALVDPNFESVYNISISNAREFSYIGAIPFSGILINTAAEDIPCDNKLQALLESMADASLTMLDSRRILLGSGYGPTFCALTDNYMIVLDGDSYILPFFEHFRNCSIQNDTFLQSPVTNTSNESRSENQTYSATSTTTTTSTSTPVEDKSFIDELSGTQKIYILAIVILVLFLIYWFFEKGPKKGIIKRRRR